MKAISLILAVAIITLACNAQEKKQKDEQVVEPKENWKVNKKVDENGNVIQYDSTYTWSYSNVKGDSVSVNLDSIMNSFNNFFETQSPFDWNHNFSFFPKNDSLLLKNFFKNDYFYNSWEKQHFDVEQMMRQMDSTRNEFLKEFYPGLMESQKED